MRVIVVGGGAAGMMAAITAAECGDSVCLYEKNEKLGKKLYITGKGRCNVTNACDADQFFSHIVTNPRFLYSSYSSFDCADMMDFLAHEGLTLKTERGNRVFPASDKSSDVIRTLERAMKQRGVSWKLHTPVEGLILEEVAAEESAGAEAETSGSRKKRKKKAGGPAKICRGVRLEGGREVLADKVILATGGLSYPSTGSTGDGYRFAADGGHMVTELSPALVPFTAVLADGTPCRALQGLSLKNVGIEIRKGSKTLVKDFGEMLFTHFGVSGPVILSASNLVTGPIRDGALDLIIDLKPALTDEQLDARLLRELEAGANKQMKHILSNLFPAKLIPVMLQTTGIPEECRGHEVTREMRGRLLRGTKEFAVKLLSLRDYPEAIITQGGVSVREVNPKTMESRKVKGLYFAGEMLDVDGFTGGYNLQIAWSTGRAAGRNQ